MKTKVENTKEVLLFVLALGQAVGESYEDGRLDFLDIARFVRAAAKAPAALADAKEVLAELSTLDAESKAELYKTVEDLELADDKIELAVEGGLKLAVDILEYVNTLRGAKKVVHAVA